jgi:SSS family solute:Na+ symporter
MNASLHTIDWIIVACYGVLLTALGFRAVRKRGGTEDYLLAGRTLTLPALVMTLVTTWYGGILGVGEYTYQYGVANWFVFGVPYYVAALLFAFFLAKKARAYPYRNLPDQLARAYGPKVARLGALVVLVTTLPAAYVLMLGVAGNMLFGVSLAVGVVAGTLVSISYVYAGGFRAVVRTDLLQFGLMFSGFIVLIVVLWMQEGSPAAMWGRLPETHKQITGGQSAGDILVWYFIALATLIEPAFYQRCYAAMDAKTARRGILWSVVFWLFFDLLTTLAGLYAASIYAQLADPVTAFPRLATDYLPPGWLGLFWVTLLAVVMSTVDSYMFVAAVTAGRDLVLGSDHGRGDDVEARYTRFALPFVAALAIVLALYFRSVVDIWYVMGSIATPALLLPVLTTFTNRKRFAPKAALLNILLAGGIALLWEVVRQTGHSDVWPFHIPSIYPGLATSLVIWWFGRSTPNPGSQPDQGDVPIA